MVGWVSHQHHNQDQYQIFLSVEYRLVTPPIFSNNSYYDSFLLLVKF